jgi:hypothetical protein
MTRIDMFKTALVVIFAVLTILLVLLYLTGDGRGTDPGVCDGRGTDPGFCNSLGPCGPGEDPGTHPCYDPSLPS